MQEPVLNTVALAEIDATDLLFSLNPVSPDPALVASVAAIGLAQPLRLQKRLDHRFRIVSGFQRFAAARAAGLESLPAFVYPNTTDLLQLYEWVLAEKSYAKPLNALQASCAITRLRTDFSRSDEEIIRRFFPLMRLAPNPRLLSLYAPLQRLELPLQLLLLQDELSIEIAAALAARSAQEQICFHDVMQTLRLGKNRQREFWLLLTDIERMQKTSFSQLLGQAPLGPVLAEPSLTPSQKSDKLKLALMHLRYPAYSAALDRYEKILQRAKLPPEIHLRPAPYFASDQFQVDFSFRSAKELKQRLKVLQTMLDQGLADELMDLV